MIFQFDTSIWKHSSFLPTLLHRGEKGHPQFSSHHLDPRLWYFPFWVIMTLHVSAPVLIQLNFYVEMFLGLPHFIVTLQILIFNGVFLFHFHCEDRCWPKQSYSQVPPLLSDNEKSLQSSHQTENGICLQQEVWATSIYFVVQTVPSLDGVF